MTPLLAALALALAAPVGEVVARVGGQPVALQRLAARWEATRAAGGHSRPADLLQDLVHEALLLQEGLAAGAERDPAVLQQVEAERRRLAGERFLEGELGKVPPVSEEDLRAAFRTGADLARVEWIVLASREEAQGLLERLAKGADFAAEAARSLDPATAGRGGALGLVSRLQLDPVLQEPAFSAPLGRPQGPLQRKAGWAVFRVLERKPGSEAEFQERRAGLQQFLWQQTRTQMRAHVLQQLRARFAVQLDQRFLEGLGPRVQPRDAAEAAHPVARVGGRAVTWGEVATDVQRLVGAKEGHITGAPLKVEYAWKRVDQLLLEEAGMERGLGKDPALEPALAVVREAAVVRLQAARARAAAPRPTEAELEALYQARAASLAPPPRRTCAHLLLGTRAAAEAALATLAKGGQSFEELARARSRDLATAEKGGLLGELTLPQLDALAKDEPALAQSLRQVDSGKVSGPVQSRGGFHLVRCGPLVTPPAPPLAALREGLRQEAVQERETAALVRHLGELRARAKVEIDEGVLARFAARVEGGGQ